VAAGAGTATEGNEGWGAEAGRRRASFAVWSLRFHGIRVGGPPASRITCGRPGVWLAGWLRSDYSFFFFGGGGLKECERKSREARPAQT
jgi:hypothetical protein